MKLIPSFNTISGGVDSIIIDKDQRHLNFVAGKTGFGTPFGTFYTDTIEKKDNGMAVSYELYLDKLTLKVERRTIGDNYRETYTFTNNDEEEIAIKADKVGIYVPFNDNYDIPVVSLNRRCHAHIWCGGNNTYIYGLRMNGESNNIGLVLTKGYIDSYGVERKNNSNDRGDFIFYLPEFKLEPKESYVVEWEMFAFIDAKDFYEKATLYEQFISFDTPRYAYSVDETIMVKSARKIDSAFYDGEEVSVSKSKAGYEIIIADKNAGEKKLEINYGGYKTFLNFLVFESIDKVIDRRIKFIIDRQQITDKENTYYGAYVLYDNEENEPFVTRGRHSDKNGARERAGMTCLMLNRLIKSSKDQRFRKKISDSVKLAVNFIQREIVLPDGTVSDDVGCKKNRLFHRKYNYAWYANVFTLMYEVTKDKDYLDKAMLILEKFYSIGGYKFYSIGIPMIRIIETARRDNLADIGGRARELFLRHGDTIIALGNNIPTHEVKYLEAGEKYLAYLIVMNGKQPDFHLNEISIRHWDGYWFGKSRLYGDTFPHHWSCLTAEVFSLYSKITGDKSYQEKADNILRNNLCLFDTDGSASCAYIYPKYVNGRKGAFYDPYANDQDWALYHMLEYSSEL